MGRIAYIEHDPNGRNVRHLWLGVGAGGAQGIRVARDTIRMRAMWQIARESRPD